METLLEDLTDLKNSDTKRDRFRDVLQQVTADGRAAWASAGPTRWIYHRPGLEAAELERAARLVPVSPFLPELRTVADLLTETGEHLPLELGIIEDNAFRIAICKWLSRDGPLDVTSLDQLRELIDGWDGTVPSAEGWRNAARGAESEAPAASRRLPATSRSYLGTSAGRATHRRATAPPSRTGLLPR